MLRYSSLVLLVASSLFVLSCNDTGVVQTGQIVVDYDRMVDFSQLETFSVVTSDVAPPGTPEPGPDELFFNNLVNDLIIEAMTSEPSRTSGPPTASRRRPARARSGNASAVGGGAGGAGSGTPVDG